MSVNIESVSKYCVICKRIWGPHMTKCCTHNSLVAVRKGCIIGPAKYYDLNGTPLTEGGLYKLEDREYTILAKQLSKNNVDSTNADLQLNDALTKMTSSVTQFLAAEIIARSSFPSKNDLPKLYPPIFNNFGHQSLFDYKMLLGIVWQVVENIKSSLSDWKKLRRPWIKASIITGLLIILIGFAGVILLPVIGLIVPSVIYIFLAIGLIVSFVIYVIGGSRINKSFQKDAAEIRAMAIEKLINGEWKDSDTSSEVRWTIGRELKYVGDSTLGGKKIPVVIIHDNEQPFTGFGRLQAENLFICRPKERSYNSLPTIERIRDAISGNIKEMVIKSGIREVTFGGIICIHGNSINIDSKWLDEDKVPILWVEEETAHNVQSIDPRVSTRSYFATQILFPQYMTAATFFIRIFWAGNSASCQVAVTTLGPPTTSKEYFLKRLSKHKREEEKEEIKGLDAVGSEIEKKEKEAIYELRLMRILGQSDVPFQSYLSYSDIEELEMLQEKKARSWRYKEEYKKLIDESIMWPGYLKATSTWREAHSFTFTTDFFGRPEAISSVRTLYDQISRAILDELDNLGFDISDYRDKEGKYSINADKIDQIVVGEKIHIEKSKESKQSETTASETEQR